MSEDWFQETKTDLFQENFNPGRVIPEDVRSVVNRKLSEVFGNIGKVLWPEQRYCKDESNKSGWITVVYQTIYHAQRAAVTLSDQGLNVFYPQTRYKCTEVEGYLSAIADVGTQKMVPAFGRYLLIQLPEDQFTFATIDIELTWLEGPFNKNGVVSILKDAGVYCITRHDEIQRCERFHEKRNRRTDPDKVLRFKSGEVVRVTDGNLMNWNVTIVDDVPLSYKVASKIKVGVGTKGAIHQVRIAWLEKL